MWRYFILGVYQVLSIYEYTIELIQPRLLYYTSHLFLLPIIYYIIFVKHTKLLTILFSMIFVNFIFSIAFWSSPIQNSIIHYIDGYAAKVTIVIMTIITTFWRVLDWVDCIMRKPAKEDASLEYRKTIDIKWYIGCLFIMLLFFYLSKLYSTIEWCSKEHLITHFMAHVMATISAFFVFS
jgi:hypothetical protein